MEIIKYQKKNHKQIIKACVQALRQGRVVAYPTDTSYGLAVDAENTAAIRKLYRVKERSAGQPVHVVVPSVAYAKRLVGWDMAAGRLAKSFWPGPLTMVLNLISPKTGIRLLSAKTKFLGVRLPNNKIALDLAKRLGKPITTTSANPSLHLSGGYDSYSGGDVLTQFKEKKHKPDILIDAGKLPRRKPSTMVKIEAGRIIVLRAGPISEKQILKVLKE